MASNSTQAAVAALTIGDAAEVETAAKIGNANLLRRPRRSLFHVVCLDSRAEPAAMDYPAR